MPDNPNQLLLRNGLGFEKLEKVLREDEEGEAIDGAALPNKDLGAVLCVPETNELIVLYRNGELHRYELTTMKKKAEVLLPVEARPTVAMVIYEFNNAPSAVYLGDRIAYLRSTKEIVVINLADGAVVQKYGIDRGDFTNLAGNQEGGWVAAGVQFRLGLQKGDVRNYIVRMDTKTGQIEKRFVDGTVTSVHAMRPHVIAYLLHNSLNTWNLKTDEDEVLISSDARIKSAFVFPRQIVLTTLGVGHKAEIWEYDLDNGP